MRVRFAKITQYVENPKTHEDLHFNEQVVVEALEKHTTIIKWAYIIHDQDMYTEDEEKANPENKFGSPRPAHIHVAIQLSTAVDIKYIAKWFNVPVQYVEPIRGSYKGFLEYCKYFTHEEANQQAKGKRLYPDEAVKTSLGFNFRKEINALIVGGYEIDGNIYKSKKDYFRRKILEGMSLEEVDQEDSECFTQNYFDFEKYRKAYVNTRMKFPSVRINIYIDGDSSVGKDTLSRAIARKIVDPYSEMTDLDYTDDNIFFEVGDGKVTFENYDGQPVIIWSECRAEVLLDKLGSLANVLAFFDPHPRDVRQNVKFGYSSPKNMVNIVNSTQPFNEWRSKLAGTEDITQVNRRIPFFVHLTKEMYSFYWNTGFFNDTPEYDQYEGVTSLINNFKQLRDDAGGKENLLQYRKQASKELDDPFYVKYQEAVKLFSDDDKLLSVDEYEKKYNDEFQGLYVSYEDDKTHFKTLIPYSYVVRLFREHSDKLPSDVDLSNAVGLCSSPVVDIHGNIVEGFDNVPLAVIFPERDSIKGQVNLFEYVPQSDLDVISDEDCPSADFVKDEGDRNGKTL